MLFLWNIAGKNLFRNTFRTVISIIAITISVAVVVFTRGLMDGYIENVFSNYINYETGHIRIVNQEYIQKERLLTLIHTVNGFEQEGLSKMMMELEDIEGIKTTIPRIKFGAMASVDEEIIKMSGWGVDPVRENNFIDLEGKIIKGRMISSGKLEILVGRGLLKKLNRQVGDKITTVFNNSYNSFQGVTFTIVGLIESDLPLLRDTVFFLPIDTVQRLLYLPDQATELLILTQSADEADKYYQSIKEYVNNQETQKDYSVILWKTANASIKYVQATTIIFDFIYYFLLLLSSIVVFNTMLMLVKERTKEIGMMTALGLKFSDILKLFILEGGFMGITGSILGAFLGGALNKVTSVYGISFVREAFEGMSDEILLNPIIYPNFDINNLIYGFLLGVIITTGACIYPSLKAARKEPSQALRNI